jgi:hypothetical protein
MGCTFSKPDGSICENENTFLYLFTLRFNDNDDKIFESHLCKTCGEKALNSFRTNNDYDQEGCTYAIVVPNKQLL